jgi:hypothetical protein
VLSGAHFLIAPRENVMHIGEVAARTELSLRRLRHWEEVGLHAVRSHRGRVPPLHGGRCGKVHGHPTTHEALGLLP